MDMAPSSLSYTFAMKGQGNYNKHSALQRDVLLKALPLLHLAAVKASNNPYSVDQDLLRIIDYGASQGANSYVVAA